MKNDSRNSRRNFIKGLALGGVSMTAFPSLAGKSVDRDRKQPSLPLKITLTFDLHPEDMDEIQSLSDQVSVITPRNDEERKSAAKDSHVWFGHIRKEEFRIAEKLNWVQSTSAGVEGYLYSEFQESNVILTNAKGCYGPAIGEHAIGLLFGLTRNIGYQSSVMKQGNWDRSGTEKMVEMKGWTMGIVGFGGIGKQVARRARGMDMRIVAMDIVPMYKEQIGDICDEMYLFHDNGLEKLIKQSDVVVSAAPHTAETNGMFGIDQFKTMRKGSYFINVSRGKLVNTDDLVEALHSNHLAGAGLDVTDPEPLPSGHSLWNLENVIITPHIAARSQNSYDRMKQVFVENVKRYVKGYPLLNQVDKVAGF